jgi:hypothetical protein
MTKRYPYCSAQQQAEIRPHSNYCIHIQLQRALIVFTVSSLIRERVSRRSRVVVSFRTFMLSISDVVIKLRITFINRLINKNANSFANEKALSWRSVEFLYLYSKSFEESWFARGCMSDFSFLFPRWLPIASQSLKKRRLHGVKQSKSR